MELLSDFQVGLSLGCNCEPAKQLRRLGLCAPDTYYAFDYSHTRHAALLKMLSCDLRDVFSGTGSLVCDETDFRFAYRPQREISKTREEFSLRAQAFRAVRESGQRVLFARSVTVESPEEAHQQWREVNCALKENGWNNFRLVFVIRAWMLEPEKAEPFGACAEYFSERKMPRDENEKWNGNDATWDAELPRTLAFK